MRQWISPMIISGIVAVVSGFCGAIICLIGFGSSLVSGSSAPGGVAVVDLDVVARRLGRDTQMNNVLKQKEATFNEQLKALQTSLRAQYDEKKKDSGDSPSDERMKELQTLDQQLGAQLTQARQRSQNELNRYRQELISRFREQIKPVLRHVAVARGLSIVVPKDQSILIAVEPAAEITDGVIQQLLANGSNGGSVAGTAETRHPAKNLPATPTASNREDAWR